MKIAVLFSGQGVQFPGMGEDLYNCYTESKNIYDQAQAYLDWDVKEVCFTDQNALINQTRYTQGALFTTTIAAFEVAKAHGIKPEAVLGFSLGEYAALVASGAIDFEEGLRLVDKRGLFMQECSEKYPGGMAAVIGLTRDQIEEVLKQKDYKVAIANDNCDIQLVISGTAEGIKDITPALKEKGAKRVLPLKVSGAFHSPLMQEAADNLKQELIMDSFYDPSIPIVSNVTARYMDKKQIIDNIPLQIINGVRFRESIQFLINEGFDTFIEIGVKNTLCNLVKKINKEVKTYYIDNKQSLEETMSQIGGTPC